MGLAALIVLVLWLARRLDAIITRRVRRHIRALGIQSLQIVSVDYIWGALRGALRVVRVVAILALVFPYLEFVLELVPGFAIFWVVATEAGLIAWLPHHFLL